jgi:rubredoxin
MAGFRFGEDAPCRHCQRDPETPRIPLTKPCPDCNGAGYVPIEVADHA